MTYEKRFLSAEDALRWLVDDRDTAGNAGTITGKCVRDGELGTTPDGDVFGAGMDDRIHMRRDLEMVIGDGMDRMTKKILDVYLECGCVRTFPIDEDGEREPGAVDYVVYWRRCSRQWANKLISRMLDQVEENLERYDMLLGGPDVAGDAGLPETDDGDGIRARRMVMTELDLAKIREYYPDFGDGDDGIEVVLVGKSCLEQ
jgi:hypothetical protein